MHFVNAKSILSSQNGMNLYRGCTHGCIYCDSRSLCYHNPIPFEDIEVKQNAAELLESINKKSKCVVQMTLTTYDEALCRKIEPNVCTTRRRYEVLKEMQARGIPTIVWMTPDLPFINDTEENFTGMKQLYQQKFGYAYMVSSPNRNQLMAKFLSFIRENNLMMDNQCFEYMHQFPKEKLQPIQRELEF